MSYAISIYGSSDDLIEIEGDAPGCDEYNEEAGTFILTGGGGTSRVHVSYGNKGVWSIAIEQVDDGIPIIPATISNHKNGYSVFASFDEVDMVIHESA